MNKQEIASYLSNLQSLMEGQEDAAVNKSRALAAEYEKYWGLLKQEIAKDETRNRKSIEQPENGTEFSRGESGRGGSAGAEGGHGASSGAAVRR